MELILTRTVVWALIIFGSQSCSGCRTLIDTCGNICMCHDVLLRTDQQLDQSCHVCMPVNNRGCFCPKGQAWLNSTRAVCVTYEQCRAGTGQIPSEGGDTNRTSETHDPSYYSYTPGQYGPSNWVRNAPACAGSNQSPISIPKRDQLKVDNRFPVLDLSQYDQYLLGFSVTNNGHTAKVTVPETPEVIIHDGFGFKYQLAQFHFHWGRNEFEGSEHLFQDTAFPVEMHFVHELVKGQSGSNSAKAYLVVSVMFEVGEHPNEAAEQVFRNLDHVHLPDSKVELDYPLNLAELLPGDRGSFFHYNGSFTTPGCDELVAWYVMMKPLTISRTQRIALSSSLHQHLPKISHPSQHAHRHTSSHRRHGHQSEELPILSHNFRPVQPLNDRVVVARYSSGSISEVRQPTAKEFIPMHGQHVTLRRNYVTAKYTLSDINQNCRVACRNMSHLACDYFQFEALTYNNLKLIIADLGEQCFDESFDEKSMMAMDGYVDDNEPRALRCEDKTGVFISLEASCTERGLDYRRLCQCI